MCIYFASYLSNFFFFNISLEEHFGILVPKSIHLIFMFLPYGHYM